MTIILICATLLILGWLSVVVGVFVYRTKHNGRDLTEDEEISVYGLFLMTVIFCVFVGIMLA